MPVSEWIDENALKYTLEKLTNTLEDLKSQKQSSYVTIEEMRSAQQEFDGKYAEKEKLEEECQTLKGRQKILKMAADTAREFRELKHDILDESRWLLAFRTPDYYFAYLAFEYQCRFVSQETLKSRAGQYRVPK